jgi:3-oxoacyl-[acyl-carrier-protein] synthase II
MKSRRMLPSSAAGITGLGAVTPFGVGVPPFWAALRAGREAFGPITLFVTDGHRCRNGAEVRRLPNFKFRRLKQNRLSRADRLAQAAAREALQHAGLLEPHSGTARDAVHMGIVVGTAAGGILELERFFRQRTAGRAATDLRCSLLHSFCLSAVGTHIAQEFAIAGSRLTIATVCSSSGLALAAALELLANNGLERVLVVGTETLSEVTLAGFNSLRSVAPERCQPFDRHRRGLVLGEGAGAMVIESHESLARRGAEPLAWLAGYGLNTDLYHFTAPQPEGAAIAAAIRAALVDAGVPAQAIDYINAHGTGTRLNDAAETLGVKAALGGHAHRVAVSSVKSMIGHTLGAASVLEAIATVLGLREGIVVPTAGLETPDPECDLDYTPGRARRRPLQWALSNSFAFGGSNISLVFSRQQPAAAAETLSSRRLEDIAVITGIGAVTPYGPDLQALTRGWTRHSGLSSLEALGEHWRRHRGGLVDLEAVRRQIPVRQRRRLNRQATFLIAAVQQALQDADTAKEDHATAAIVYGSAFGCSNNVHRFYSRLLAEGPQFTSPQEFNLSVTNAPPALVAQGLGLKGPIWVFAADEASWDVALGWGARLIRCGRAARAIVCAAEEMSDSVLTIHATLGLLDSEGRRGLTLGEGAVAMILEPESEALRRGAHCYGRVRGWRRLQDVSCGPQEYASDGVLLRQAARGCLEEAPDLGGPLDWLSPENGLPVLEEVADNVADALRRWGAADGSAQRVRLQVGESGLAASIGLAALLGGRRPASSRGALVLTCARGGVNAATLLEYAASRQDAAFRVDAAGAEEPGQAAGGVGADA